MNIMDRKEERVIISQKVFHLFHANPLTLVAIYVINVNLRLACCQCQIAFYFLLQVAMANNTRRLHPQLEDKRTRVLKKLEHAAYGLDLSKFASEHREKAAVAIQNRRKCPNCDAKNCQLKCAKCRSVSYCNKKCQVNDWSKHKNICKMFQHVLATYQSMPESYVWDNRLRVIGTGSTEAFCVMLLLAGIEAEVILCITHDYDGIRKISPLVLTGGRIYDVAIKFYKNMFPDDGFGCRHIQPLPPDSEIAKTIYFEITLIETQNNTFLNSMYHPWIIPSNIDPDDREILVKHLCRAFVECHYLTSNYRSFVLDLYREFDTIWKVTGESTEQFKIRMDTMYDVLGEWSQWHPKHIEHILIHHLPFKSDTRQKLRWCNGEDGKQTRKAIEQLNRTPQVYCDGKIIELSK